MCTSSVNSFVSSNPVSSLTQITRRASLLATGGITIPRSAGRLSLPFATTGVTSNTGMERSAMKEAEINSATDEAVSAAMAALHRHRGDTKVCDYGSNAPPDLKRHVTPSSSQLDVITEAFLERSIARKLQSREGLLGSNVGTTGFLARTSSSDSQAVHNGGHERQGRCQSKSLACKRAREEVIPQGGQAARSGSKYNLSATYCK